MGFVRGSINTVYRGFVVHKQITKYKYEIRLSTKSPSSSLNKMVGIFLGVSSSYMINVNFLD